MLQAEIRFSQAVYADGDPSPEDQLALLQEAVALAPEWPNLHLRSARAHLAIGDLQAANKHAVQGLALLDRRSSDEETPFDPFHAITGEDLGRDVVRDELTKLGLARDH